MAHAQMPWQFSRNSSFQFCHKNTAFFLNSIPVMVLNITDCKYFPIFIYPLIPVIEWCPGFPRQKNLNLASYMWNLRNM